MNLVAPFLTDPKQIRVWLDILGVKCWKINKAGSVDVAGTVALDGKLGTLTRLPVRFGRVSGDFWCSRNQLVCLDGIPREVGNHFHCHHNQIVSLEGSPKEVGGGFYCGHNQLVSLKGAPKRVGGNFWCNNNLLVDFKGVEGISIAGSLVVADPIEAGQDNVFVSLDGLPKELYSKVQGLDMQVMLELENKRATSLAGNKVTEELSSEVELG